MKKLLAYVSGPYRSPTEWGVRCNIQAAEICALKLWSFGFAVICPHKNTEGFTGACGDPEPWIEGDLVMIKRCDLIVMLPDWAKSEGARAERMCALRNNIPVYYWPFEEELLEDIGNGILPNHRPTGSVSLPAPDGANSIAVSTRGAD